MIAGNLGHFDRHSGKIFSLKFRKLSMSNGKAFFQSLQTCNLIGTVDQKRTWPNGKHLRNVEFSIKSGRHNLLYFIFLKIYI